MFHCGNSASIRRVTATVTSNLQTIVKTGPSDWSPAGSCCGEEQAHAPARTGSLAASGIAPLRVSVIVAVYNRVPELQKCLEALHNALETGELIVVDDHSAENVRDVVERYNARYLRLSRRTGPAAARNFGATRATGNILMFVDADVVVHPNALSIVSQEFENSPELTALFGSYDDDPPCADFCSLFKNLLHHHVHQVSNPDAGTFWTGCGAIRKQAFEVAGGFDAVRYPAASIEDIELGSRLTQQRQKIRLIKQLQVKHLKKWTFGSMIRTDIFHRAIPWTQLILRTRSIPGDLNLTSTARVSSLLVAAASLLAIGMVAGFTRYSGWFPRVLASGFVLSTATLLHLNRGLYRFFWRKRGTEFAIQAVLAHWMYLFYSGSVFTLCCVADVLQAPLRSSTTDSVLEHLHRNSDGSNPSGD
jgi:glycosyltransferase involved in cell wall biosynthesis